MSEPQHSKFSASAASRWLSCPGSMVLSVGKPDSSSKYAAWGTLAHELADGALRGVCTPEPYLGTSRPVDGHQITVDQDMVDCVNTYLAGVREVSAGADMTWSEERVNYSRWLGVPEDAGWGTLDFSAVFLAARELLIADLKTGMGVEVDAEDNEQGMLYASGKLLQLEALDIEVDTIRILIFQPRIKAAPSEWTISVVDLKRWLAEKARTGAMSVQAAEHTYQGQVDAEWQKTFLQPTEKGCRWCKAKATCPALREEVLSTVMADAPASPDEFPSSEAVPPASATDAQWLGACLSKADMIEDWIKAVRAEVERRLLAGEQVPGFKLVEGKQGNRAWSDAAEAEALFKSFRLKQEDMYDFSLKSPTQIAKLGPELDKDGKPKTSKPGAEAPVIGPRQWPKVAALITRAPAKKHVAPLSDKRPAIEIKPVVDEFEAAPDTSSVDIDSLV